MLTSLLIVILYPMLRIRPDMAAIICSMVSRVLLEIKAVKELSGIHEAQILNYLKATGVEVGSPDQLRKVCKYKMSYNG